MSKITQEIEAVFADTLSDQEVSLIDILKKPELVKPFLKNTGVDLASGAYAALIWILHNSPIENVADRLSQIAVFLVLIYMLDETFHQKKYQEKIAVRNKAIRQLFQGKIRSHADKNNNFVTEENQLEAVLEDNVLIPQDRNFLKIFHVISSCFLVMQLFESTIDNEPSTLLIASLLSYLFTRILLQDHYSKEATIRKSKIKQVFVGLEDSHLALIEGKLSNDENSLETEYPDLESDSKSIKNIL